MEDGWRWLWPQKIEKINLRKEVKIMNYGEFGGQYVPQCLRERLN